MMVEILVDLYNLKRDVWDVCSNLWNLFPDSQFLYTSHGWTLVSAVVEKAAGKTFEKYLTQTLDELGMTNTYLEYNAPIIPNRGR